LDLLVVLSVTVVEEDRGIDVSEASEVVVEAQLLNLRAFWIRQSRESDNGSFFSKSMSVQLKERFGDTEVVAAVDIHRQRQGVEVLLEGVVDVEGLWILRQEDDRLPEFVITRVGKFILRKMQWQVEASRFVGNKMVFCGVLLWSYERQTRGACARSPRLG
jgi:hypothetical protein